MGDDIVDKIRQYAENDNIDYSAYKQVVDFINDTTSIILGIIFWVILATFSLMVAMDIAYLTIPTFRDVMYKKGLDGSVQDSKVKLISAHARNAVIQAETKETGRSALGIYLKKRIIAWMQFVAVMLIFFALYEQLVNGVGQIAVEVYLQFKAHAAGL